MTRFEVNLKSAISVILLTLILSLIFKVYLEFDKSQHLLGLTLSIQTEPIGLYIHDVSNGSPSELSDMQINETIIQINNTPVADFEVLDETLRSTSTGDSVTILTLDSSGLANTYHVKPGMPITLIEIIFDFLAGFVYLSLFALTLKHWHTSLATKLLTIILGIISTDYLLPYSIMNHSFWGDWLYLFNLTGILLTSILEIHLFFVFPRKTKLYQTHTAPILFFIYGGLFGGSIWLLATNRLALQEDFFINHFEIWSSFLLALITALLIAQLKCAKEEREIKLSIIVFITLIPWVIMQFLISAYTLYDKNITDAMFDLYSFCVVLFPFGIIIGILRYDLLNIGKSVDRKILHRAVTFFLAIISIVVLIALYELVVSYIQTAILTLILVVLALLTGHYLNRLSLRSQVIVDRGVFPAQYQLKRKLDALLNALSGESHELRAVEKVSFGLQTIFDLKWCAIYLYETNSEHGEVFSITDKHPFSTQELSDFLIQIDNVHTVLDSNHDIKQSRENKLWSNLRLDFGIKHLFKLEIRNETIGYILFSNRKSHAPIHVEESSEIEVFSQYISQMIYRIRLEKSAHIDELTGTLRREAAFSRLKQSLHLAFEEKHWASLAVIDLDHFKRINDRFGHPFGDQVLQRAVEIIKNNIKGTDILGRYGGEEFVLYMPNTNLTGAQTLLEKIRQDFSNFYFIPKSDSKIYNTLSVGVISLSPDSHPDVLKVNPLLDNLISQADQLLYKAKRNGRNQIQADLFK